MSKAGSDSTKRKAEELNPEISSDQIERLKEMVLERKNMTKTLRTICPREIRPTKLTFVGLCDCLAECCWFAAYSKVVEGETVRNEDAFQKARDTYKDIYTADLTTIPSEDLVEMIRLNLMGLLFGDVLDVQHGDGVDLLHRVWVELFARVVDKQALFVENTRLKLRQKIKDDEILGYDHL